MNNKDIFDRDFSEARIRFLSLDANKIYYSILYKHQKEITIKNKKDGIDDRFTNLMPPNLDLIYLNEKGKLKVYEMDDELYSYDLIKVNFNYDLMIDEKGKLTTKEKKAVPGKGASSETIRKYLYLNGFVVNGKKYVRYKRSSRAAKNNTCLFIKESLFKLMNEWSLTGLSLNEKKDNCLKSLTSFEAYYALSISDLTSSLKLNPYNILFVKDCKVMLHDEDVIRVSVEDKHLVAKEDKHDVENNIFDGEGLMDTSVFEKAKLQNKGMMLLRNRFFKCCAFNTKLQEWFKANNITSVDQLYGHTFAKSIEDIVLVVSESCLKYSKMCIGGFTKENVKRWCDAVSTNEESIFGIVKTDKAPRFFGGQMVETTYQFINTIKFKSTQLNQLIKPYFEYISMIHDIKHHPEFVRYYFEGEVNDEEDEDIGDDGEDTADTKVEYSSYSFKNKVCLDLMKIDKKTTRTTLFKEQIFKSVIDSFYYKIFNGRLLIDGTNATLFGNPYEFLNYIILKDGKCQFDKDNPTSLLNKGEIYCSFFQNGDEVVGMRSPHTTMGNLLFAKNKYLREIKKWFKLTHNIVVVDAIFNNIQYRLSGCDYDSDSMLLTKEPIIKKQVLENYDKFLVPYSDFVPEDKELENKSSDKKENILLNLVIIDNKIARNNVGKIVNLSQLLNSHLWNKLNKSKRFNYKDLYNHIAALSILSGAEIDSSKRSFGFDTNAEYKRFEKWARDSGFKKEKPVFFAMLSSRNGRLKTNEIKKIITNKGKERFSTAMDMLWYEANTHQITEDDERMTNPPTISELLKPYSTKGVSKATYDQIKKAFDVLVETKNTIAKQNQLKRYKKQYQQDLVMFQDIIKGCYKKIKTAINNPTKAKMLIEKLEKENTKSEKGNPIRNGDKLLLLLFFIISTKEDKLEYTLTSLFKPNSVTSPTLKRVVNGRFEFTIFGSHHYKIDAYDAITNKLLRKI